MDRPPVCQLCRQVHRWVSASGMDKRWKHLSAKPSARLELLMRVVVDYDVDRVQVYSRWRHSRALLIARNFCHPDVLPLFVVVEHVMTHLPSVRTRFMSCLALRASAFLPVRVAGSRSCMFGMELSLLFPESFLWFCLFVCCLKYTTYSGGYSVGVPPLPIPNREVKPDCADGTAMQCGRVGSCLLL